MRRYTAVRVLTQAMESSDLAIYIGENVCKEAYPYKQHENNLYFTDEIDGLISFALGIAMGTLKRVFVYCEDQYFIRNISEFIQVGVSKCKNFIMVLLVSGSYTSINGAPTIFDAVGSQHGVLFNCGTLVHDYTRFFKLHKNPVKHIREFWSRTRGPLSILLRVETSYKELPGISFSSANDMIRVGKFIQDENIKGHTYTPPFSLEDLDMGEL